MARTMEELRTYEKLSELIDELKNMKEMATTILPESSLIQPVRVGNKIGFVNWQACELECLPIFDDYDRSFTSHHDCICVRQDDKWGVLNNYFRYELPVEFSYSVANQVCRVLNQYSLKRAAIRAYGAYMKFS